MLALNNNWPTIPLKELIDKLFGSPLTLFFPPLATVYYFHPLNQTIKFAGVGNLRTAAII